MILRANVAARLPVALVDNTGAYITGMTPSDINDGTTQGSVTLVKADGTVSPLALTLGSNFFEVDATAAPGLYHVLVPAGALNVVGTFQLVVQADAGAFLQTIISAQVDSTLFTT